MNKLLLPLALLCCLSCSNDEQKPAFHLTGEWVLKEYSVFSWQNGELMSMDLPWEEHVVFRFNKTFEKTRKSGEETIRATGTYTLTPSRAYDSSMTRYHISLQFESGEEIIGGCSSSQGQEDMVLTWNDEVFNTWAACDGPLLVYRRQY
ncbi:hypothetical protein [Pleomorphovibrio marinus]|uniref:hypothetical protein n=1 Tax=Pleomorphovibrio marinus TaxID=2164132 RepID=UPI0013008B35|nr:hypothetical protein [Pleomorphovibrio marinus]